jgi:hypothetical protein
VRGGILLALVLERLAIGALLTISAALYAHNSVERLGGVNV